MTNLKEQPNVSFKHVGWWIPGSLNSGWQNTYQANFTDMSDKFNQLGIKSLVPGMGPIKSLGFYFSEAEYDFIQLLTGPSSKVVIDKTKVEEVETLTIVTYSIWLSTQQWAGFSPYPIFLPDFITTPSGKPERSPEVRLENLNLNYPVGWYLTGSFLQSWYADLKANYKKTCDQLAEMKIAAMSDLYFAQSTSYDFIQMVQPPVAKSKDGGVPQSGPVEEFAAWFNNQGFGTMSAIPFMSPALVGQAIYGAGNTP